jgi:SAM-dependent methyltransferase
MRDMIKWVPMKTFVDSWKSFRAHANEAETISKSLKKWRLLTNIRTNVVIDIGCGDGSVLKEIITRTSNQKTRIECTLLDPMESFIKEAQENISVLPQILSLNSLHGYLENNYTKLPKKIDVVYFIHTAYVVTPNDWKLILKLADRGATIIWIMDDPKSIFTHCWSITAEHFYDRLQEAHQYINNLISSNRYNIEIKKATVLAKNPFEFPKNTAEKIMSLICYADYTSLPNYTKQAIRGYIEGKITDRGLPCDIAIIKISPRNRVL